MVLDNSSSTIQAKPFSAKGSRTSVRSSTSKSHRIRSSSNTKHQFNNFRRKTGSSRSIRRNSKTKNTSSVNLKRILKQQQQPTPLSQQKNRSRNIREMMKERVLPVCKTSSSSSTRLKKPKNRKQYNSNSVDRKVESRSYRIPKLGLSSRENNRRFVQSSFDRNKRNLQKEKQEQHDNKRRRRLLR